MTIRPFIVFALSLPAVTTAELERAIFTRVAGVARLASPAISEASGLAISPSNSAFMWIVNDSGLPPEIHLVGTDGTDRGKLKLKDGKNIDWEDLASFSLDGEPYLLVADTGDNNSKRDSCILHIVREPDLPAAGKTLAITVPASWQIRFTYEGGPRDCESVAVDEKDGKILLISKRTNPPEIYELPLQAPNHPGIQTARLIGKTAAIPQAGSLLPFNGQPTGFDISKDGSFGIVLTYHSIFLFPRNEKETWDAALTRPPVVMEPHRLIQAEAASISEDARSILVISEGKNSAIVRYEVR